MCSPLSSHFFLEVSTWHNGALISKQIIYLEMGNSVLTKSTCFQSTLDDLYHGQDEVIYSVSNFSSICYRDMTIGLN